MGACRTAFEFLRFGAAFLVVAVLRARWRGLWRRGSYVFTTAVHTSVLGALLTFSPVFWYAAYTATAPLWGWTPLEDQQAGGLIMWVPAGVVYIVAGVWMFAAWLRESESRTRLRESGEFMRAR